MKIRIYYLVIDGGDGSAYPHFFKTQDDLNAYLEEYGDGDWMEGDLSEGGSYEDFEVSECEVVEC